MHLLFVSIVWFYLRLRKSSSYEGGGYRYGNDVRLRDHLGNMYPKGRTTCAIQHQQWAAFYSYQDFPKYSVWVDWKHTVGTPWHDCPLTTPSLSNEPNLLSTRTSYEIYLSLTHSLKWEPLLLIHPAERLQAGTDEMKRTAVLRYGPTVHGRQRRGGWHCAYVQKFLAMCVIVLCQTSLQVSYNRMENRVTVREIINRSSQSQNSFKSQRKRQHRVSLLPRPCRSSQTNWLMIQE